MLFAKRNAHYSSKTLQNDIIKGYACKVRVSLTKNIRENNLPFTVICRWGDWSSC